METFLKFFTVFGSIVVPLLIASWNAKHSLKKHPKEEFAKDVEVAERFSAIISSSASHFVKDRVTQQVFETKKITFQEGEFFYQFNDTERWVRQYIEVRDQVKLVRNSKGKILKIHYPYSWWKKMSFGVGYVVFTILGLMPFLFLEWFIEWYLNSLEAKQYLIIFNIVVWPIIFLSAAVICLVEGAKYNNAQRFVKKFNSRALKI